MPQPEEVTQLSTDLRAFADQAWQRITDLQEQILDEWPEAPREARRARLAELKQVVAQMRVNVDALALEFVQTGLPAAYTLGAALGNSLHQFTAVDFDAVNVLARDTYSDVLAATGRVSTSTKQLVRLLSREHMSDKLLTGQTAQQAARDLRRELEGRGVTAITYKNGARHGLSDYSSMLSRTKSAVAYNLGTVNAATAAGTTFMECFDGFGCGLEAHGQGAAASGLILPVEQARQYLIAHPNCIMPGERIASYGAITEMVRARYAGPALTLKTSDGATTVGPNHPVLTRRGWMPAHLLHEGDELVHDRRLRSAVHPSRSVGLHFEQMPAVEDVFVALERAGVRDLRLNDLHGDAVFCEGEVEVVRPPGELLLVGNAASVQQASEGPLVRSNAGLAEVARLGESDGVRVGAGLPDQRASVAPHPVLDLFGGHRRPHQPTCVANASSNAGGADQVQNETPAAAVLDGHVVGTHARDVVGDDGPAVEPGSVGSVGAGGRAEPRLVGGSAGGERSGAELAASLAASHDFEFSVLRSIERRTHRGWVYDCSTEQGAFNAGGFVVKNCQRSWTPRPDVTSKKDAKDAPRSQTAAQAADQQQVAAQREQAVANRARLRARDARLAARAQKLADRAGV